MTVYGISRGVICRFVSVIILAAIFFWIFHAFTDVDSSKQGSEPSRVAVHLQPLIFYRSRAIGPILHLKVMVDLIIDLCIWGSMCHVFLLLASWVDWQRVSCQLRCWPGSRIFAVAQSGDTKSFECWGVLVFIFCTNGVLLFQIA